jgi:hypothetical protein
MTAVVTELTILTANRRAAFFTLSEKNHRLPVTGRESGVREGVAGASRSPPDRQKPLKRTFHFRRHAMKTTFNSLVTILSITAASVVATSTEACGGNKGRGGGGGFSMGYRAGGVGIHVGSGHGGRHHSGHYTRKKSSGHWHTGGSYPNGGYGGSYPYEPNYGQAYEPFHSSYFCQPGDSFYTVSLKEYGTSAVANHIARFNRLQPSAALVPGQRLVLPSVSASGQLTQSRAPAPFVEGGMPRSVAAATPVATPTAKVVQPAVPATLSASVTAAPSAPALPKVAVGSTLVLDGQEFGNEQGVARLRVSGLSLPIEMLEWTASAATVRLPKMELAAPLAAEIEVLRADGSLASKTGIELTPAAETLALGN